MSESQTNPQYQPEESPTRLQRMGDALLKFSLAMGIGSGQIPVEVIATLASGSEKQNGTE